MNESQLAFEVEQGGESQEEIILAVLQHSHPGHWVSMKYLGNVAGCWAVHSRIAGLRKKGFKIENLVDRKTKPHQSFYRIAP